MKTRFSLECATEEHGNCELWAIGGRDEFPCRCRCHAQEDLQADRPLSYYVDPGKCEICGEPNSLFNGQHTMVLCGGCSAILWGMLS